MRKIALFVLLALSVGSLFAIPPQPGYYFYYFYTFGDDCYADGSMLLEGECYAIVWRSAAWAEKTEGLFYADGRSTDPENCQLVSLCSGAARTVWEDDGHEYAYADNAYMQVPWGHLNSKYDREKAAYKGVYSLFIFDTRTWNGSEWTIGNMSVSEEGCSVSPLNAYGLVTDLENIPVDNVNGIFISGSVYPNYSFLNDDPVVYGDGTVFYSAASTCAAMPPECPAPAFSAFAVTNGVATVSVTNTASYLTYGLSMVDDVLKLTSTTNFVGERKQGVGAAPLTWEIPVGTAMSEFFKLLPRSVLDN